MATDDTQRLKGQGGETPFILTVVVMFTILTFMTLSIQATYPQFQLVSAFDLSAFGVSLVAVAGTCVIATGLPCAAALAVFSIATFFVAQNTLVYTLIFLPLIITVTYVVSRLGRGGG